MKKMITLFLSISLLLGHISCDNSTPEIIYEAIPESSVGKRLVEGTDLIASISSDKNYKVTEGLEATEIKYLSQKGLAMKLFIFEVDLTKNITIGTSTPDDKPNYGMQQMTEQARKKDTAENPIWGAINADFYNMTSGMPQGIVYKNGLGIKTTFQDAVSTFFAIKKDGTAVVGDQAFYNTIKSDIKEAVGGRVTLVQNGIVLSQASDVVEPRTAIGISEDGKKVYMLVIDGRNFHYSNGMNYTELAQCFRALGAYNAINLDGGGSSTFIIRNTPDFTDDRFEIRNWPTDKGGLERAVANGLVIMKK